jgi:hypothetical protein
MGGTEGRCLGRGLEEGVVRREAVTDSGSRKLEEWGVWRKAVIEGERGPWRSGWYGGRL